MELVRILLSYFLIISFSAHKFSRVFVFHLHSLPSIISILLLFGLGFVVWYYTVWCAMFSVTFVAIEYGGVDALALVSKMDAYTGFDMASRINPTVGSLAVALIANECLEPIRLVFVVSTTKPVVHMFTGRT